MSPPRKPITQLAALGFNATEGSFIREIGGVGQLFAPGRAGSVCNYYDVFVVPPVPAFAEDRYICARIWWKGATERFIPPWDSLGLNQALEDDTRVEVLTESQLANLEKNSSANRVLAALESAKDEFIASRRSTRGIFAKLRNEQDTPPPLYFLISAMLALRANRDAEATEFLNSYLAEWPGGSPGGLGEMLKQAIAH